MLNRLLHSLGFRSDAEGAGAWAEKVAANWLVRERGFVVVARNWRNPQDRREELDLVCRDGDVLVFVEVKARAAQALVSGYYAVDVRKKRVLLRAAKAYLQQLEVRPLTFRLDVVEVELGGASQRREERDAVVRHFESVPLFPKHYR